MTKREGISKKLRFEVFKRDKFTCQYCGSAAPNVVLNVDHILPVAKGGQNHLLNLVTSCFDCNSGKKDRLLSDDAAITKQKAQLDVLQTKREQLEMMMQWHDELMGMEQEKVDMIQKYWGSLVPGYFLTKTGLQSLKKMLQKFEVDEIISAMKKTTLTHLRWKDQVLEQESVAEAWGKVAAICQMERIGKDNPDLKEFYYIRGILRNRINYHDPKLTIQWLEAAKSWGASIQELKDIALSVRNWTKFSDAITDIIERYKALDELEKPL